MNGITSNTAIAAIIGTMLAGSAESAARAQSSSAGKGETRVNITGNKFYCNIAALKPAERARYKELTEKLFTLRKQTVEFEKGYEFQYSPKDVSIGEVAEWVTAESKCCPFFDFHIDLENEGQLVSLRLTGAEGIKAFIRIEFGIEKR